VPTFLGPPCKRNGMQLKSEKVQGDMQSRTAYATHNKHAKYYAQQWEAIEPLALGTHSIGPEYDDTFV